MNPETAGATLLEEEVRPLSIVVAGASGLLGQALVAQLRARGHRVRRLVRRAPRQADEIRWNPATGELDPAELAGIDAAVNLAGENIASGRWTAARRERILRSRVDATRTLVAALGRLDGMSPVLVNASAVGVYGDCGDRVVTEASPVGAGFLPGVVRAWEAETEPLARQGGRVVLMRLGVVLTPEGGALAKMLPVFRLGLGGRLGTGRQWLSWITLEDAVAALLHALGTPEMRGPVNVVTREPVTNAEFTFTLAGVLGRPAWLPVPAAALRLIFGEMADATLLASTRASGERLRATGFECRWPWLGPALRHLLGPGS